MCSTTHAILKTEKFVNVILFFWVFSHHNFSNFDCTTTAWFHKIKICINPYIYIWISVFECVSAFRICVYSVSLPNGLVVHADAWMGSCLVCIFGCLGARDNSTPGHWSAPDPRGHEFWPLGSSQQRAHRVAGRLGLLQTQRHTYTAQWYDEWYVRKQQHVYAHSHTHGWLEGKSSCRLSMTSNKRTIENNKTGSHSGSSRKSFPLLLQATSQHRAIQTPEPLSNAKLVLNGFTALWRDDHWILVSENWHLPLAF